MGGELDGKTALVTGGSTGLGRVTALELAKRGAEVVIIARNESNCEAAVTQIKAAAGHDKVSYQLVDLASFKSIEGFAQRFKTDYQCLDILVNNAGVVCPVQPVTEQGIDATIGINYVGHFYLTTLLIDLLVSSKARLVVLSSGAHEMGDITMDDLAGDIPSFMLPLDEGVGINAQFKKYGYSNRARIYFAKEICKRYPEITAVSVHPGAVKTALARDMGCWIYLAFPFLLCIKSPEDGATTSVHCATEDMSRLRGEYFVDSRVKALKPEWILEDVQTKLWDVTEKFCNAGKGETTVLC